MASESLSCHPWHRFSQQLEDPRKENGTPIILMSKIITDKVRPKTRQQLLLLEKKPTYRPNVERTVNPLMFRSTSVTTTPAPPTEPPTLRSIISFPSSRPAIVQPPVRPPPLQSLSLRIAPTPPPPMQRTQPTQPPGLDSYQ